MHTNRPVVNVYFGSTSNIVTTNPLNIGTVYLTNWVHRVKSQKTIEQKITLLKEIPKADISVQTLLQHQITKKLETIFLEFNIGNFRKILKWMDKKLNSHSLITQETNNEQLKAEISPIKFLFEVIKISLTNKELISEFGAKEKKFTLVRNCLANLSRDLLIND